ncbi:MAG: HD domain-containing protein [Firmicutes bacterium]|nr:HD domain-containing protein [Bacillota bacterium]
MPLFPFGEVIKTIYTPETKKALRLCFDAHKEQTDKSGLPYVFHPFHVAEQMPDEKTTIAALLHDVIEDTAYTLEDLRGMGFDEDVLEALTLLAYDHKTPYPDYVAKIKENEIARTVKLADLRHNSDLTRLDEIDEAARKRIEKYHAAIELLMES